MTPVLRTKRLELSAFTLADGPDVFAYASDPEVARTVTWNAHRSEEDSLEFIRYTLQQNRTEAGRLSHTWAIRLQGKAVGSISFAQPARHIGQIDYALGRAHWNQGLVTEAARAVVEWAMGEAALLRVQSKCLPGNLASRRVMEKVGMQFEGITRAALMVRGEAVDLANYALVRGC